LILNAGSSLPAFIFLITVIAFCFTASPATLPFPYQQQVAGGVVNDIVVYGCTAIYVIVSIKCLKHLWSTFTVSELINCNPLF